MLRTLMRLSLGLAVFALALTLRPSQPALAIVHLAEISEIMVGFDGDADVQYVEINMRLAAQNITVNAKLATFNSTGTFIDADAAPGDQPLLTIPGNVPNSGAGVRWIMGTTEFETASGIQADFEFPASPGLPASVGMVCLFENGRDFTDPTESVDCVAYGGAGFTGTNPNSSPSEAATTGPGDGTKSLTRIVPADLGISPPWARSDDANDFALRCPTPENNAGELVYMGTTDDDGDGFPNCHESELGTDPNDPDTDGDFCDDGDELGDDEVSGGKRDPLDKWDYFNPNKDDVNRIPDIVTVVLHFGQDVGAPGSTYDVNFDRGGQTGANVWNQAPPNGTIRVPDIVNAVVQFGHDCAA